MNVHTAMSDPLPARTSGLPWPVWAMLGLALITLAGVGWQRLAGGPPAQVADVTWQRALHFEDRSNGDVAVLDAQDRREVARFQGEQGFLRGALRALSRERRARGLGPEQPFQLMARPDGRLTLVDPVTDQRIDLESFGPTNASAFARLLQAPARP